MVPPIILHLPVFCVRFFLIGGEISATVQTGHGANPDSCTMGTGSFPEIKWPGRGVAHPP